MKIQVLDKGYIELVEVWGSDERIIESARMSTNGGFVSWEPYEKHPNGDLGLLRYLWKHRHMTPFEQCGMTFEIYAPIFVVREWMRHRTQSYNEMSGRYTELPDDYYVPSLERLANGGQSASNKQAAGDVLDNPEFAQDWFCDAYLDARNYYEKLLSLGMAKELARMVLPVAQYSRFRASANLRNWLGFLDLRDADGVQWEMRQYAKIIDEIAAEKFPRTHALFAERLSQVPRA